MRTQTATEYLLTTLGMVLVAIIIGTAIVGSAVILSTVNSKVSAFISGGVP